MKRRLAWSTVSNLSYVLFGVVLMSPLGLVGAMTHMVCHAFIKISAFFCAGAVIYKTGREYVHQINGFGYRMPKVFLVFTVAGLALMGVPGLSGFASKWNLVRAALDAGTGMAYLGIGALLISALLTAIYMLSIVVRAFFPGKDFDAASIADVEDPNWMMILPLTVFTVVTIFLGVCSGWLTSMLEQIGLLM